MENSERESLQGKSLRDDENIKALIVTLANTSASLENGEKLYATLGRTVRRLRTMLWVAVIGLTLSLSLTLSFAFILVNQADVNRKIQGNTDAIQAQQVQIHRAECELNALLLSTDTPERYAAAPDKKKLVEQYHVLYESRKNLG